MQFKVYQGGWWEGLSIRNFSAFCENCRTLFRHSSDYEGGDRCPICGDDLRDVDDVQGEWDEQNGDARELTQDEEGNWGYDR